jgi:hypothetical protein
LSKVAARRIAALIVGGVHTGVLTLMAAPSWGAVGIGAIAYLICVHADVR